MSSKSSTRVQIIAFQGEQGAYSEAAALKFCPTAVTRPCVAFEDVFRLVGDGSSDLGIVPFENSIGGSIHRNFDLLLEHDLPIVAEVELRVVHCLLANRGTELSRVRRIYSHPQALAQCDQFLRRMTGVEVVATYDTAGSAKLIRSQNLPEEAAIASERAAAVFDLQILASGIEDFPDNITRFLLLGSPRIPEGTFGRPDKTTIVFSLRSVPGALFRALRSFADRQIDLSKLESRPLRGRPWEYLFFADLGIGRHEGRCRDALGALDDSVAFVRVLGSYRSARMSAEVESTSPRDMPVEPGIGQRTTADGV